jgi:hypothetical protein
MGGCTCGVFQREQAKKAVAALLAAAFDSNNHFDITTD